MRSSHVLLMTAALIALLAPSPIAAQHCDAGREAWSVRLSQGRRSAEPGGDPTWTTGLSLDKRVGAHVRTRGRYIHQHAGSAAALRTGGLEITVSPSIPLRPCIGIGLLISTARLSSEHDHYRNAAVPLSLGWGVTFPSGDARLRLSVSGLVIYSATDARLFGFNVGRHGLGWGGSAQAGIDTGRLILELDLLHARVPGNIGPNGLGRSTVSLSTGWRL